MSNYVVVLGTYRNGEPEFRVAVTTPETFELLELRTEKGGNLVKKTFSGAPVIESHRDASMHARGVKARLDTTEEPALVRGRTFYGYAFPK